MIRRSDQNCQSPYEGLAIFWCHKSPPADRLLGTGNWKPENRFLMQIRVLFFGVLKDLAGKASDSLSLPENATLGDVLSHYEQVIPG